MAVLETTFHALGRGFRPARPTAPRLLLLSGDFSAEAQSDRDMQSGTEGLGPEGALQAPLRPVHLSDLLRPGQACCGQVRFSQVSSKFQVAPQGSATPAPVPSHSSSAWERLEGSGYSTTFWNKVPTDT